MIFGEEYFQFSFLNDGMTVFRIGMFWGSFLTITGDSMEPSIPPMAPEQAIPAVEIILSDSGNQV